MISVNLKLDAFDWQEQEIILEFLRLHKTKLKDVVISATDPNSWRQSKIQDIFLYQISEVLEGPVEISGFELNLNIARIIFDNPQHYALKKLIIHTNSRRITHVFQKKE